MVRSIARVVLVCFVLSTLAQGVGVSRTTYQDPVQQGNDLLELSSKQNQLDHAQALTTAREALTRFQNAKDDKGIAKAYFQIARSHLAMSNLTEATENYQIALQRWQALDNANEQAETLINLAFIEQRKGEWLNAVSYYNQAQLLSPNNTDHAGQIASGLGDLLNETGVPESALAQFQRALEAYQQAGNARGVNNTLINIGYTKFLQGDYSGALNDLHTGLATSPLPVDAAWSNEYLSRVYLALHEYPLALKHLEPALAVYERAKNPGEAERVRTLIGQVYEQQGALDLARERYRVSLAVTQRLQDRIREAAVQFALGRLELKAGHLEEAESYLKKSIEKTEDLRSISIGRDITTAYSASVHERYEAYITCLLRLSKSGEAGELVQRAFEASELSRGRALIELLRDTQTNLLAGVDPALVQREKNLRQAIRAKMDYRVQLLESPHYKQEELNAVEATLTQLRAEHQQLSEQLRKLNPAYGQVSQPTAYSLPQIQTEIVDDNETALVEYHLGEDRSYVWVVTRNNIKLTELQGKAAINEAVQKTYDLLSKKPESEDDNRLTQASNDLAALVLAPIADQLPARRIIIVADGALNYIPFQILPLPSTNEPLIASHEVINAPSASILGQLRQERSKRTSSDKLLAAFGYPAFESNYAELRNRSSGDLVAQINKDEDPAFSRVMRDIQVSGDSLQLSGVQPLENTRTELAYLRDLAGPESLIASGFTASRETLEHTDFSKYAVLHLATHAYLDPKRPEYSGFLLSTVDPNGNLQNGYVTVQDVYALRAPVSLVVLSACRTGLGKDSRGEGLISLTRAFMYAGASSIAASLWNVNDEATAELMKQFYTRMLQDGMAPAAALRAAQNNIRQQPLWRSPHYWAAFTLHGEYEQPIKVAAKREGAWTTKSIVVVVLLLLGLSAIPMWYWRKRAVKKS